MKNSVRFLALIPFFLTSAAGTLFSAPATEEKPAIDPLQVHRFPSYYHSSQPLTPIPEIVLRFSAPVSADAVQAEVSFTDDKNQRRVPGKVGRPDGETMKQLQPWGEDGEQLKLSKEHFVTVTPTTPLATGVTWQIRLEPSLTAKDGTRGLARAWQERLGTLSAFTVSRIGAVNHFDTPNYINISLNKTLPDEFSKEALAGFLNIHPKPGNFAIETSYHSIQLKGDFELGRSYKVSVFKGLMAYDETSLESEKRETVKFVPNDGFVSLPAFSRAQNASGSKRFDIITGNLESLRVRVKLLNDRDLIYALRGYDELYSGYGDDQKIPFEMVPGRVIFDHEYPRTAKIDQSDKISLEWKKILKNESKAALYVCAEGWSETKKSLGVGAQAIIQLTDIGLAWKQDRDETMVFAFSLKNGKPLGKLSLEALDENAESLVEFQTNEEGVGRIASDRLDEAKWLGARRGKDRHIIESFGRYDAIGLWQFSIPYRYDELEEAERRVLLFTDRGVYKPGEEVHLKCISRLTDGDQLLPMAQASGKAKVRVTDPRNRVVYSGDAELSAQGTFDLSFELPEGQAMGYYSINVDFNDPKKEIKNPWSLRFGHSFQVADFRPNTFEIAVDTESAEDEETDFSLPVSAKYYMGKALSKARLNWRVAASPTWPRVRGFDRFRFGDSTKRRASFSASETMSLSDIGTGVIDFTLPPDDEKPAPMRVNVSASITDLNQQTIVENESFVVDSSDFYLGVRRPEGIVRAGEETTLALAAVSPAGEVHQEPVEATLLVEKMTFTTVKVRGAGGRITDGTETELDEVMSQPITITTRLEEETGLPIPDTLPLSFEKAGDYQVTITSRDEQDRKVISRVRQRIIGADEPAWTWHDGIRIDVTPDKEKYAVGDVAKLLVRSPVLGNALITTERAGVRQTQVQAITEHETVIEIPIEQGAAPNLFASVLIVRGSADSLHEHPNTDYRLGYCQLMIDDPAAALTVAIEHPDDVPYQLPGAKVTMGARVTDFLGKPVRGAEVTLYAVDEGVLSLTDYQTPKPSSTFHQPFPLAVFTGQTLSDLLPESPHEQNFGNKGYVIGGGGAEGVSGIDPNRVRKNFQSLAFWSGALITDAKGRVRTTFQAPDNLTSYRVIAVVAEENRFGSADDRLVINKPLILEPALPAFSNVGDRMDLSAVLHNNTEKPLELEIRVELDRHAEFLPEAEGVIPIALNEAEESNRPDLRVRRFSLGAGESSKLGFPVLFTRKGEATWRWQATDVTDAELTDAVESNLSIGYPLPLLREAHSFTLKEGKESGNLVADVDPRLLNGSGEIKVTVANSRVVEALDALDYLLHYPYGCVEQTTSTTLPWLSTQRMRGALPQLNRTDAEIEEAIAQGTKRLLAMQTSSGGLSYWPGGDKPMLWGSAYGGMALALAERQGVNLPKERLDALWKYLSSQLRDTAKVTHTGDLYQHALALYTLAVAGKSEASYHDLLYQKRAQLSYDSRSLLALAMMETAGDERNDTLKERVGALLARDEKDSPENQSLWYRRHFSVAMDLLAWSRWDALDDRAEVLLDELLGVPKGRAAWGNTYLNSWGVIAVTQHAEATVSALEGTVCTVTYGDESREVVFGNQLKGELLTFEYEEDRRNMPLKVSRDSDSRLYTHVEIAAQPALVPMDPEDNGLGIERSYHLLGQDGSVQVIKGALEVGDLVLVTLNLDLPQEERYNYLAIDDPLPSIFEAVNPNFETQAGVGEVAFKGNWKRLYCNHRELQTDRALFFADSLYRGGNYAVQYLARVVAPGDVTAPPAKVEIMYEPQRFGLSGTVRISAKPLQLPGKNHVAQK